MGEIFLLMLQPGLNVIAMLWMGSTEPEVEEIMNPMPCLARFPQA
jgi:hypothetical protein